MVFLLRRINILRVWVQSADQQQFSHHLLKLPVPYTVTDGQIKQFLLDNTFFVTLTAKCFVFSLILSRDVLITTDFLGDAIFFNTFIIQSQSLSS